MEILIMTSRVLRIEKDIRTLRDSNKTDVEIRALLGLELRTYQNYLKKIHEEDQAIWYSITSNEMATELLRLKACLEDTYLKAKQLSENEKDVGTILEGLDAKDNARVNIVMLLIEGPHLIEKVQGTTLPPYDSNRHISLLTK